jgi:hypothetical protein
MIERLRRAFNASWSAAGYEEYKARLASQTGAPIPFRVCESPVFLPVELRDRMFQGALEIFDRLLAPDELERSKAAVPAAYDVPGCDAHPLFAVADFAIAQEQGALVPRLIELQGFPSLYGFQLLQARLCRAMLPGEPLAFLKSRQFGVALMGEFQFLLSGFQFGDEFGALSAGTNDARNEEKDRHAAQPLERKSNHGAKRNLPEVPIRSDQGNQKRDNGCSWQDRLQRQ